MSLASVQTRLNARFGAIYTLRKANRAAGANSWTAGAETPAFYPCRAKARHYRPNEIRGGIQEKDILVTVDEASIEVAPEVGDGIALGTHVATAGVAWGTIVNVYTTRVAGAVTSYRLQVRA